MNKSFQAVALCVMLVCCTTSSKKIKCSKSTLNSLQNNNLSDATVSEYRGPFKYSAEGISVTRYQNNEDTVRIIAVVYGETLRGNLEINFLNKKSYVYRSENKYYHTWDDTNETVYVCDDRLVEPIDYDLIKLQDYIDEIFNTLDRGN